MVHPSYLRVLAGFTAILKWPVAPQLFSWCKRWRSLSYRLKTHCVLDFKNLLNTDVAVSEFNNKTLMPCKVARPSGIHGWRKWSVRRVRLLFQDTHECVSWVRFFFLFLTITIIIQYQFFLPYMLMSQVVVVFFWKPSCIACRSLKQLLTTSHY